MNRNKVCKKQQGQGLIEYALILVLVAAVIITAMSFLGGRLGFIFMKVNNAVELTTAPPVDETWGYESAPKAMCETFGVIWTDTYWVYTDNYAGVQCYHKKK